MMDINTFVMANGAIIRMSFFFGILGVMALWEVLAPRRALTVSKTVRWVNNLGIVFLFLFLWVPWLQSPEGLKFRLDCPVGNDISTLDGHVVVNQQSCIRCGLCIDVCPNNAIHWTTELEIKTLRTE